MLDCDIVESAAVLRLNSPPVNAISWELLAQLRAALEQAQQDASVQGAVLTGDANHFSAGVDVNRTATIRFGG